MTPFRLQIEPAPNSDLACRWFGQSALRPEGALTLPLGPEAAESAVPERFAIDLAPLLAEVFAGLIPDADALAAADDLLPLRDLLGETGLAALCEALFLFLWRAARAAPPMAARRGADGRAWAETRTGAWCGSGSPPTARGQRPRSRSTKATRAPVCSAIGPPPRV